MLSFLQWGLRRHFDAEAIRAAIAAAERQCSAEIRVSVAPFFFGDVRKVAEKAFQRLGMTQTEERNGVLFFVVPSRRKFVILGDEGIHAKAGQQHWERVAGLVSEKFRAGDFNGGLLQGIAEVGQELALHFPSRGARDVNELPDDISFGK